VTDDAGVWIARRDDLAQDRFCSGTPIPSTVSVLSATNVIALLPPNDFYSISPIKALLTEDCRPCTILVVLCAGILMSGESVCASRRTFRPL
jgi:hypothetical protein